MTQQPTMSDFQEWISLALELTEEAQRECAPDTLAKCRNLLAKIEETLERAYEATLEDDWRQVHQLRADLMSERADRWREFPFFVRDFPSTTVDSCYAPQVGIVQQYDDTVGGFLHIDFRIISPIVDRA